MLNEEEITAYNASRNPDFLQKQAFYSFCYAPYTAMHFKTDGSVRACCHMNEVLANVTDGSIRSIWFGEKMTALREAVKTNQLHRGCQACEMATKRGFYNFVPAKNWDLHPTSLTHEWPQRMEFAISNVCNLECVMCSGLCSSLIRQNREKLPPLNNPYGDAFFTELREFLPHLKKANFLGGEPFLQPHCYRIWDIMIEDDLDVKCQVSTNGTVFDRRVERVLSSLRFDISVSADGCTKETVESIRVGADFETQQRNIRRFREYATARGTYFSLSFCLITKNWREFGDFCVYAESLGCRRIAIHKVVSPASVSLYSLPAEELKAIVAEMDAQAADLLPKLQFLGQQWTDQVNILRQHAYR